MSSQNSLYLILKPLHDSRIIQSQNILYSNCTTTSGACTLKLSPPGPLSPRVRSERREGRGTWLSEPAEPQLWSPEPGSTPANTRSCWPWSRRSGRTSGPPTRGTSPALRGWSEASSTLGSWSGRRWWRLRGQPDSNSIVSRRKLPFCCLLCA